LWPETNFSFSVNLCSETDDKILQRSVATQWSLVGIFSNNNNYFCHKFIIERIVDKMWKISETFYAFVAENW